MFDGLVTAAVVSELRSKILTGKIEKVYQPEADELIFNIHTKTGNCKLYASCSPSHARIHFITQTFENPVSPMSFCMLMRKHFQGGRIVDIAQVDGDRIIEITVDGVNELQCTVSKKLIIEIMGKHSNIIAVDCSTGKIIDSIKRVSIDINRIRQILPGKVYQYPPKQDKLPYNQVTAQDMDCILTSGSGDITKSLMDSISGISPALANHLAEQPSTYPALESIRLAVDSLDPALGFHPTVYLDKSNIPKDFHAVNLSHYDFIYTALAFPTISETLEYFYINKASAHRVQQKSVNLEKSIVGCISKLYLKKQRLSEDLLKAENSEDYRLFGELLTANLHLVRTGDSSATLLNYYDNSKVTIPLDIRFSPAKNAQMYFKKYGKAKTAIKEKKLRLEETDQEIVYLESVAAFAEKASSVEETEEIRNELIEGGYLRKRKNTFKVAKSKSQPHRYTVSGGYKVLVGRNNAENDKLTFKLAGSKDLWFHTKDIPGSHVILFTEGRSVNEIGEQAIFEAASIAAYYSKGSDSENVPVDYVSQRYVKKPNGAKPGMVIFTNNRTVWVNPVLPQ